ncbi:YybH family protein [Thauera phenolivorans]|uniref:YybH family protein n=1 Tax=Thauera phenolivorans TaxID=1792543 RepID=UPI00083A6F4E|nr:nuclear transport factor 2 family protein [Thauera phenolivorans]
MNTIAQARTPQERAVLEVFDRHVAAFNSGDVEAVLNDFDERSVVVTQDGVFEGRERIRALYQELLAEFGVIDRGDSPGLSLDALHLRHEMLFIVWHAESKNHMYPFGTDTFICREGKFERQSIAFSPPQPR